MHTSSLYKEKMYVFGGLSLNGPSANLYSLSTDIWEWNLISNFTVGGREMKTCGHTAVVCKDKLLLFGGVDPADQTTYN